MKIGNIIWVEIADHYMQCVVFTGICYLDHVLQTMKR